MTDRGGGRVMDRGGGKEEGEREGGEGGREERGRFNEGVKKGIGGGWGRVGWPAHHCESSRECSR